MYKRSPGGWAKHWDFILIDTICLQISFILSYLFRYQSFIVYARRNAYRTTSIVLLLLCIMVAILFNTMHNVLRRGIWEEVKSTLWQCGLVYAAIVAILYTAKDSNHVSRLVMYGAILIYMALGFSTRLLYKRILLVRRKSAKNREMLLVGDGQGIERAMAAFAAHPEEGVNITALVRLDKKALSGMVAESDADRAGIRKLEIEEAADFIRNEWIDEVYIAALDATLIPADLISQCSEMAVTVHQQLFMETDLADNQMVERIAKQPVLTTSIIIPEPGQLFVKRMVDIFAGVVLSVIAVIELIIVTPIIKRSSPGPVLLKPERVGQNGRRFKMFMIRTMYMDAAEREDKLIKGIGVFLRKWTLDQLPKGFNLLLGQMSLVGTRAPSVEEWEGYQYRHRARLACKPGITGLWQVCGGGKAMSFEEATVIDTQYITNWNLSLDWRILFAPTFLKRQYTERISGGKE